MITLGVPSGIGDCSWIVSKLINSPQWPNVKFLIADGWPYRTKPLFDMVGVESDYGKFDYNFILTFEQMHPYETWKDVTSNGFGVFYLQPNMFLERDTLNKWLPDLETNYHYKLKLPQIKNKKYYNRLTKGDWIGISAASYRGHEAWRTWDMRKWKSLVKMLLGEGYNICFLGGSWDDLTRSLEFEFGEDRCLSLVGQTEFDEACAIQKLLKFYIGFSSGLGIIRTVLGLPTIMLFPDHLQSLSVSWADPKDVESRKYMALTYVSPKLVFKGFKRQESNWR